MIMLHSKPSPLSTLTWFLICQQDRIFQNKTTPALRMDPTNRGRMTTKQTQSIISQYTPRELWIIALTALIKAATPSLPITPPRLIWTNRVSNNKRGKTYQCSIMPLQKRSSTWPLSIKIGSAIWKRRKKLGRKTMRIMCSWMRTINLYYRKGISLTIMISSILTISLFFHRNQPLTIVIFPFMMTLFLKIVSML